MPPMRSRALLGGVIAFADRQFATVADFKVEAVDCGMKGFSPAAERRVVVEFDCDRINAVQPRLVVVGKNHNLGAFHVDLQD